NTDVDYQHYGVPRAESRARFEEAAEIVKRAWSAERFSYHGRYWSLADVAVYPRPVQQPHPPIWVAGASPASLGWAGRQGYNIMTVAHPYPPAVLQAGVAAWREGLRAGGVDPAERHC